MKILEEYQRTRDLLFESIGINPLSNFIATDGPIKNAHYLEMGSGKPLILIHGGGSHSSEWYSILKPLSAYFHLYVVDRPGCGLSDSINYRGVDLQKSAVDFVRSVMDALNLKRALVVGQSMGGYFGICFALQFPHRVDKLLLIGAPAGMNRWIPPILRLLGTKVVNRFLTATVGRPSLKNLKKIHQKLLVANLANVSGDYLVHTHYGQLLPGYKTGFLSLLENALNLTGWRKELYIGDQLHRLEVPVRFIWGDHDAFESPETGKQKALAISDQQFITVENAGHCPWLDQPEKCADWLIRMLTD